MLDPFFFIIESIFFSFLFFSFPSGEKSHAAAIKMPRRSICPSTASPRGRRGQKRAPRRSRRRRRRRRLLLSVRAESQRPITIDAFFAYWLARFGSPLSPRRTSSFYFSLSLSLSFSFLPLFLFHLILGPFPRHSTSSSSSSSSS